MSLTGVSLKDPASSSDMLSHIYAHMRQLRLPKVLGHQEDVQFSGCQRTCATVTARRLGGCLELGVNGEI